MRRIPYLLMILALVLSGCTNYMYQGQFTGPDAYGKERHFLLYWPKTEQLIGTTKAGPAILLTECSLTRIDFDDQPQAIIFRGEPGRDRLAGQPSTVERDQTCGKILNYAKLADVPAGNLQLEIDCEPMSDEFAVQPRNYLKASREPYQVTVMEKTRHWSLMGETLPGPVLDCVQSPAK